MVQLSRRGPKPVKAGHCRSSLQGEHQQGLRCKGTGDGVPKQVPVLLRIYENICKDRVQYQYSVVHINM